jgi:hypothetical protein
MKATFEIELAPVYMLRCFYPVIEFEATPEFKTGDETKRPRMNVNFEELAFADDASNKDVFRVTIGLEMTWPDAEIPPYRRARILCVGDFRFAEGTPDNLRERHKYLSAPSMLYSGTREFVKSLSGSGPYGQIMLPGAIFTVVPVKEDAQEQQEPADQ